MDPSADRHLGCKPPLGPCESCCCERECTNTSSRPLRSVLYGKYPKVENGFVMVMLSATSEELPYCLLYQIYFVNLCIPQLAFQPWEHACKLQTLLGLGWFLSLVHRDFKTPFIQRPKAMPNWIHLSTEYVIKNWESSVVSGFSSVDSRSSHHGYIFWKQRQTDPPRVSSGLAPWKELLNQNTWPWSLALLFVCCVTLGRLSDFSAPCTAS